MGSCGRDTLLESWVSGAMSWVMPAQPPSSQRSFHHIGLEYTVWLSRSLAREKNRIERFPIHVENVRSAITISTQLMRHARISCTMANNIFISWPVEYMCRGDVTYFYTVGCNLAVEVSILSNALVIDRIRPTRSHTASTNYASLTPSSQLIECVL